MGRSVRLRVGEVRAAVRLATDCRNLGADLVAWRARLMSEVQSLVGAAHVMVGEFGLGGFRAFDDIGWPCPPVRPRWLAWVRTATAADHPAAARFAALPGAFKTRRRRHLLTDREWYGSWVYSDLLGPAGLDDGMLSTTPLADGAAHLVIPARAVGDRPFDGRESRLLHLLHSELAPGLGRRAGEGRGGTNGDRPIDRQGVRSGRLPPPRRVVSRRATGVLSSPVAPMLSDTDLVSNPPGTTNRACCV